MRKFSLLLVAAMLLSAGSIYANTVKPKPKNPAKSLSAQIQDLLDNNDIVVDNQFLKATAVFTLNEFKEIVVLSVATDDQGLETFVKSRLNYQKVILDNYREGKIYRVPIRIIE